MEDFERKPTAVECSVGWQRVALNYIGNAITLAAFFLASEIALSIGLKSSLLAVFLSSVFLATGAGITGYIGAKTRLSTYMIITKVFGNKTSLFLNFIFLIIMLGWFSVTLTFFGETLSKFFLKQFNFGLNLNLWIICGGIIVLCSAIFGFKGLDTLSRTVVPMLLILLYSMIFLALKVKNFSEILTMQFQNNISFGQAVSLFIGIWITGVCIIPDTARYSRNSKDGIKGGIVGFIVGQFIVNIPCFIIALAYEEKDFLSVVMKYSSILAMFVLVLATWTTNDDNMYSCALSSSTIFKKTKQIKLIIVLTIIGIAIACMDIVKIFIPFLSFLGVIIPSITIIYIIDFFINRRKFDFYNRKYNSNALICLLIGSGFASLTYFNCITLTNISAIDGFLVSGILYYTFEKINKSCKK